MFQDESLFTVCEEEDGEEEEEEDTSSEDRQTAAAEGSSLRDLELQPLESASECVVVTAGQTTGTAQPGSYTVTWNRSVTAAQVSHTGTGNRSVTAAQGTHQSTTGYEGVCSNPIPIGEKQQQTGAISH